MTRFSWTRKDIYQLCNLILVSIAFLLWLCPHAIITEQNFLRIFRLGMRLISLLLWFYPFLVLLVKSATNLLDFQRCLQATPSSFYKFTQRNYRNPAYWHANHSSIYTGCINLWGHFWFECLRFIVST